MSWTVKPESCSDTELPVLTTIWGYTSGLSTGVRYQHPPPRRLPELIYLSLILPILAAAVHLVYCIYEAGKLPGVTAQSMEWQARDSGSIPGQCKTLFSPPKRSDRLWVHAVPYSTPTPNSTQWQDHDDNATSFQQDGAAPHSYTCPLPLDISLPRLNNVVHVPPQPRPSATCSNALQRL